MKRMVFCLGVFAISLNIFADSLNCHVIQYPKVGGAGVERQFPAVKIDDSGVGSLKDGALPYAVEVRVSSNEIKSMRLMDSVEEVLAFNPSASGNAQILSLGTKTAGAVLTCSIQ